MKIKQEWFDNFPTPRDLKIMNETVDVRILAEMGSAVCFKWKNNGRSPQYWIAKKYLEDIA